MKINKISLLVVGTALFFFSACTSSGPVEEKPQPDSVISDSSQLLLQDTALVNYAPDSGVFVDEGGEGSPREEIIVDEK